MSEHKTNNLLVQLLKLLAAFIIALLLSLIIFCAIFADDEDEALPAKYNLPMVGVALMIAVGTNLIVDYNGVQRLRGQIERDKKDIESVTENADALIDKAERVADKYRSAETALYADFAHARQAPRHIRNSSDFKSVMENYPELQSNVHTQKLLEQLQTAENAKLRAKLAYSDTVARYNAKIHSFPVVLLRRPCKWTDVAIELAPKDGMVTDEELGI